MKVAASSVSASFVSRWLTALLLPVAFSLLATSAVGQQRGQTRQQVSPYEQLIELAASRYRLDLYLFRALVETESSNKPGAISPKGARGLTQLMPATARRFGVRDVFDPAQSIEGGARYLRWLLDRFNGNYTLALAGYNAGEGAVEKFGWRVPPYPETESYVSKIQRTALAFRASAGYAVPTLRVLVAGEKQVSPKRAETATSDGAAESNQVQPPLKAETYSRYFWQ